MSSGHGTDIPLGAKRFLVGFAFFFLFATLTEINKYTHFLPDDFFSRGEVRVTTVPKLTGLSYTVKKVVDGDTLVVRAEGGSTDIKVRLIGINTPETVDPRRPVECFGKEASNHMKSLASGETVYIETDETQGEYDKYGRMLAYVYLTDGQMLNRKMLAEGYAYEYTYHVPYKYQQDFKEAQNFARGSKRGLWAPDTCNGVLQH